MSIKRYNAKRDANEPEIIAEFIECGASVESIDTPCDLLVGFGKVSLLVEVKTEKGTLTKRQKDFIRDWQGQYAIVRTREEASQLINNITGQENERKIND